MIIFRFSSTLACFLMLGACGQRISDEGLICDPTPGFIANDVGSNSDEQAKIANLCIHKFGYRFGRAEGSNREIADAVVGRCRSSLDRVLQLRQEEGAQTQSPFTTIDAKNLEDRFREEALRRVVEGRAGKCDIRGEDQK